MRSQASVFVNCDRCDFEVEIFLFDDRGENHRQVDGELEKLGWRLTDEEDICEECVAKGEKGVRDADQ